MKLKITKELFQWEKNKKVYVESSPDEPQVTVIEFYNAKSKAGDAVEVTNNEAEIPNYLLKESLPITAVACIVEDGENTPIYRKEFRVLKRACPEGYIDDSIPPSSPVVPDNSGGTSGGSGDSSGSGTPGAPGADGEDGATFVPIVSSDGIISWTNNKGLENPKPVNIMGPRGLQGEVGPQGPQGIQGPKGPQGEKGDQGPQGIPGEKGADGTMTFEDLTDEQKESLKGEPGPKGEPGTDGYTPIKGIDYFTEEEENEFINKISEKTYSKDEIDDKISKVNHLKRTIVSSSLDIDVNAENADQYVYMVPKTDSLTEDSYDEYMVIEGKVEKIGNEISLANYYTKSEVDNLIPSLDTTLTQSGAAADAKTVGEALKSKAETASYTCTLSASDWSNTAPYTQTVTVPGILGTDSPFVDVYLAGIEDGTAIIEAWIAVGRVETKDNSVTAYCYEEKPEVDIPIILKVVR